MTSRQKQINDLAQVLVETAGSISQAMVDDHAIVEAFLLAAQQLAGFKAVADVVDRVAPKSSPGR